MVLYTYRTHKLCVILDKDSNPWYCLKHLWTILVDCSSPEVIKPLYEVSTKQSTRDEEFTNDDGLFSMTSSSSRGKPFIKWLSTTVLPDVRKRTISSYETQINNLTETLTKRLEIERYEKEAVFNQLAQKFERNELVYILTNDVDCKNNVFKVGKTTKNNLRSRLTTYNTGASSRYYYVFIKEVYNAKRIEKGLSVFLDKFKYDSSQSDEIYRMNFEDLREVVMMFITNDDVIVDFMSANQTRLFQNSVNKSSNPSPITHNSVSFTGKFNQWISQTIKRSKTGFFSIKMIVQLYKEQYPMSTDLARDIAAATDSYMNSIGVYQVPRHYYTVNGSKKTACRVYLGYTVIGYVQSETDDDEDDEEDDELSL